MVGIEGLRHHVRRGAKLAKYMESLIRTDSRFEILFPVDLGLICFRLSKNRVPKEVSVFENLD